jgi:hypothetical protein
MSKWGNALAGGLAAAAKSGAESLGMMEKEQMQVAAEQRAADLQLATQERLMAIKEAQANRASEHFSNVVKQKIDSGLPMREAEDAALNELKTSNPAAYTAGMGMLSTERAAEKESEKTAYERNKYKEESEYKKSRDEARDKLDREKMDRDDNRAAADRAARAREAAANREARYTNGSSGGKETTLQRNVKFLKETLGWNDSQINSYLTDAKGKRMTVQDAYLQLKKADKFADDDELMVRAQQLVGMAGSMPSSGSSSPASSSATVANPVAPSTAPARLRYNPATGKVE